MSKNQESKKKRKKVCNVSRYVTQDSQIITNISSQCSSAIMDVIYNLRTNSPTSIGDRHYNWYKYAHAIMSKHRYNGEPLAKDEGMSPPPPPSPDSPESPDSKRGSLCMVPRQGAIGSKSALSALPNSRVQSSMAPNF